MGQGPFEQIPPAFSQIGPPKKSKTSIWLETSSPKSQKHRFGSRHSHQNTKNIDLDRDILTKIPKTSIWLETSSPKYQNVCTNACMHACMFVVHQATGLFGASFGAQPSRAQKEPRSGLGQVWVRYGSGLGQVWVRYRGSAALAEGL